MKACVGEKFPAIPYPNIVCPVQADAVITLRFITTCLRSLNYNYIIVSSPQTELGHYENNRFVYQIHRSPMCDYMINFVHKLKQLPEKYMMNSVLENFTILQVRTTLLYMLLMVHDHSVTFLLSGFTNLQTNCPLWKPELKMRYPLICHLFLCASCV